MQTDEQSLVFMMGEFSASIPRDRLYAKNHMWLSRIGTTNTFRCGLTAYAVRLLQDVYFLDWEVDPPTPLAHRQAIGSIESKKAESELYSPIAGILVGINQMALDDPSVINVDSYDDGWLLEIESDTPALLSPEEYIDHLHNAWPLAQRTIKGQIQ